MGLGDIDVGTPPTRFARGWHCLGLSEVFRDGDPPRPHAVQAFGTKLVVFADAAGELHVLDAYSAHGRRPDHGHDQGRPGRLPLSMTGAGAVTAGARRSLRAAGSACGPHQVLAHPGTERRQLFVWHDPEGNPPPDDVTIPRIDGAYSDDWTDWTWDSILVEGANCREVIDNVVDMAHFFYIHFAFPTYFKNVLEGHVASQYLRTRSRPDVGGPSNYSDGSGGETTLRSEASFLALPT